MYSLMRKARVVRLLYQSIRKKIIYIRFPKQSIPKGIRCIPALILQDTSISKSRERINDDHSHIRMFTISLLTVVVIA